jgi:hypothetical protein
MASAGPAAGLGASTATAPAGSGWRSGIAASGRAPVAATRIIVRSAVLPEKL